MDRISVDEVPVPDEETRIERRKLTAPLSATELSLNHYVLYPGQALCESLHAHMDQEELFVVLDGTVSFETREGQVVVDTDEVIRFAPGEFQRGRNAGETPAVVLGIGAPRDTDDLRIARTPTFGDVSCPDCGLDNMRLVVREDDSALVCPACETELDE
jgi:mannose-6-phosphate isomerase-like protein (cupin superfamily)